MKDMKKNEVGADYERVLKHIGQFGPWQRWIFFWMCFTSAASGLLVVVYVFTGYDVKYRCAVPYCENATEGVYGIKNGSTFDFSDFVLAGIPKSSLESSNECKYYNVKSETPTISSCEEYLSLIEDNSSSIELQQCTFNDLIFDNTYVSTSTVTEFELTCDSSYLKNIYGSTYMVGLLFGSFILGLVSDHFGRLTALMIAVVVASVSGTIGAFLPSAPAYGFFRFLTGMGGMGCFMVTFVLSVECVGAKYTTLIGVLIEIPFAIGELILGLEAYAFRDYLPLQLVAHAPLILLLGLWFLVPESPRWLMAMGKFDEAAAVIEKAAKVNGKPFPEHIFKSCEKHVDDQSASSTESKVTFLDLFRPKTILLRSLNMFYQWFSVTLCYFGLSYASTSLLGDPYTNFSLSVFIEIPGYIFCALVMDCWGRRPILSFTQIISGAACIAGGLISGYNNLAELQLLMSLIGKFGASASFAIIYVYAAELFPTAIRNTAIGSCSTVARFGAILALLIGLLGGPAPMLILGISAVIGGILALFFPETVGHKLPQTMEEALHLGKDSTRGICTCVCPKNLSDMFAEDDESSDFDSTK